MRKRREDVDWYVEMSEWLERKERRRKWVVLGVCVAVPLFLMGAGVLAIALKEKGFLKVPGWAKRPFKRRAEEEPPSRLEVFDPILVGKVTDQGIKFAQLAGGLATATTFFFREVPLTLPPREGEQEARTGFIIRRESETVGHLERYKLVDHATGEAFEFEKVPVQKVDEVVGWAITEEGWLQIRDQLRAEKKVELSRPIFQ